MARFKATIVMTYIISFINYLHIRGTPDYDSYFPYSLYPEFGEALRLSVGNAYWTYTFVLAIGIYIAWPFLAFPIRVLAARGRTQRRSASA